MSSSSDLDSAARPFPLVLAAPSGTGKTTIVRELVKFPDLVFSVSATTRDPRPGERPGVDYEYISKSSFEEMVDRGELAEWAEVHGNLYGTPNRVLETAADSGLHAVLDIDVQGARQVRASLPAAVLFFVLPPTAEDLLRRLSARGTEDPKEVARRLRNARDEMQEAESFDYVVVNDDVSQAVDRIRAAIVAEKLTPRRSPRLGSEIDRIREEIERVLAGKGADESSAG